MLQNVRQLGGQRCRGTFGRSCEDFFVSDMSQKAIASPGWREIRLPAPVFERIIIARQLVERNPV